MDLHRLIEALRSKGRFGPPAAALSVIETHISVVVLTDTHAYKFKKPVNFGFLDFSTLDQRRFFCLEELRLNRRLAPQLYLDVLAVTGSEAAPEFNGTGPSIEYCVRMRRFPDEAQLDRVLRRGDLRPEQMTALGSTVAEFHLAIPAQPPAAAYGAPETVLHYALENFDQIGAGLPESSASSLTVDLRVWTENECTRLRDLLRARRESGFVRECHGDMHLTNMVLLGGEIVIFDCIEFNPALVWIDVMNEVAFLLMDLDQRGRPDLGFRFLNRYLEVTGDYAGLAVLNFYRVYRSVVRAKVAYLQAVTTDHPADRAVLAQRFAEHTALADRYRSAQRQPLLLITHGCSGSGKSWLTEQLCPQIGAIRLRSDIERKRLAHLDERAHSGSGIEAGVYAATATERTYARLIELARGLLQAGFPVILDATFLKSAQRAAARQLADELKAPYRILSAHADADTLRARIAARARTARDPSEADLNVLEHQLAHTDALSDPERPLVIDVDTGATVDFVAIGERLAHAR